MRRKAAITSGLSASTAKSRTSLKFRMRSRAVLLKQFPANLVRTTALRVPGHQISKPMIFVLGHETNGTYPNWTTARRAQLWSVLLHLIPTIAKRTSILRSHCYLAGLFGADHKYPIAEMLWCTRNEPWKLTPVIQALAEPWAPFSYMSAIGMKQNHNSMLQFDSI